MQIIPVRTRRHWRQFYRLRREIYRDDPAAVMPLQRIERSLLDVDEHPFYQHASREVFLCVDDEANAIGTIAAIRDDMHLQHYNDNVGFFGFFEVANTPEASQCAQLLIDAAANWLRERDCKSMRGPVNPSMKSEFGIVTEGNELPPSVMIAHTPARYADLTTDAGLTIAQTFYCFRLMRESEQTEQQWKKLDQFSDRVLKRFPDLEFRPVEKDSFAETMRSINELGNEVRREGYGFVPLTDAELSFMIKNLRRVIRTDMIHVAWLGDTMVGYVVNIPDINWALKRTVGRWDWMRMLQLPFWIKRTPRARVIALGVHADYRTRGIALVLMNRLVKAEAEYREWEFSWVQHDNVKSIRAISRVSPLKRTRTFHVYEKEI